MDQVRTFLRVAVPCRPDAPGVRFDCPKGWRPWSREVQHLSCGWFSLWLVREQRERKEGPRLASGGQDGKENIPADVARGLSRRRTAKI